MRFLFLLLLLSLDATAQITTTSFTLSEDAYMSYPISGTASATNGTTLIASTNRGGHTRIFAGNNTVTNLQSLVPANAIIASAYIQMQISSETTNPPDLRVQRILSSWSESSTSIAPTLSGTLVIPTYSTSTAAGITFRNLEITGDVQQQISTGSAFYGWMIRCTSESSGSSVSDTYSSSESGLRPPSLVIQYYLPFSITGATIVNSTASGSTGSVTPTIINGPGSTTYSWTDGNGHTWTGASVSSVPPGIYYMEADGTYTTPSGAVLTDKFYYAFVVGAQCELFTVTFQPPPEFVDDAPVSENYVSNQGTNTYWVSSYDNSSGVWRTARTYAKFRLWMDQVLPLSAPLTLTGSSHTGVNNSTVDQVTSTWDENTIVYTNEPTTGGLSTSIPQLTGSANYALETAGFWNIWRTNNLANYGFKVSPDHPTNTELMRFYSADYSTDITKRPKIVFTFDDPNCDRISYSPFLQELDGGYTNTFLGKLKIQFPEEYKIGAGKSIPLILYSENHTTIAGITADGTALTGIPTLLPSLEYNHDDNRGILNLSGLSLTAGKYYILELTRSTGEKGYLRFIYQN